MQDELWNTPTDSRVAIWASEEEAREQLRQQPGLASEQNRSVARSDDGRERVVAERDYLLAWASAGAEA